MNTIVLVGTLHGDPARRDTTSEVVTTFRLAVHDHRHRLWIDIEAWGQLAGTAAAHLTNGRCIGVTGRLRNKPYTARDGQRRDHWHVLATDIWTLDPDRPTSRPPGERADQTAAVTTP